jgi:hypothetical protein
MAKRIYSRKTNADFVANFSAQNICRSINKQFALSPRLDAISKRYLSERFPDFVENHPANNY